MPDLLNSTAHHLIRMSVWSGLIDSFTSNAPEGNGFALYEQPIPENGEDCYVCSTLVGASAVIEEVQIGDIPGEYVENGVWQAIGDTGQWGWNADPPIQKLRWRAEGVAFELSTIAGVSKEELFAIAESIISPATVLTDTPISDVIEATATPQSQPLLYFTHAESDVLPLQPWQLTPNPETPPRILAL